MFCAGWVHRDISSGNILAYQESGGALRAKLADLEYARKFPRDDGKVAGDPKTVCFLSSSIIISYSIERQGTPYFMAIEILELRYLAVAPDSSDSESFEKQTVETERTPQVVHNFQHDLESVWWILLWTITCRIAHPPSQAYAKTIFDNSMRSSLQRYDALAEPLTRTLRTVLKESLSEFSVYMESMRKYLLKQYRRRYGIEKLNNPRSYTRIHHLFRGFFMLLEEEKDLHWHSDEPLLGSVELAEAPATGDDTTAVSGSDSAQPGEQPTRPRIAAPKRAIRLIASRDSIQTRSHSNSQGIAEASGSRFSKRQKKQK